MLGKGFTLGLVAVSAAQTVPEGNNSWRLLPDSKPAAGATRPSWTRNLAGAVMYNGHHRAQNITRLPGALTNVETSKLGKVFPAYESVQQLHGYLSLFAFICKSYIPFTVLI